jgi:DNA-binding transcriptional LysR family regulator
MRQINLDLDLLRCFVTVVETGGFTAASKRLHRTQSTVSVQIKRLEESVGKTLLDRSRRNVSPTEQGEMLLSYARRILKLNDETVLHLSGKEIQGTLRLGIVEYLAPHRLPQIISKLRAVYPRLDLRLRIDLSSRLRNELEEGKLDLVIAAQDSSEKKGKELFQEQLCWAVGPFEIPEAPEPLPLAFLPPPCFYREAAIQALDEIGRPWVCAVTTMNISGVQSAVSAGLAVGVLSRTSLLPTMKMLGPDKLFPALPSFSIAVFTKGNEKDLATQPLIDFIAKEISHYKQTL